MPKRIPVLTPLAEFLREEAAGGIVLLVATLCALVWANLAGGAYASVWTEHRVDAVNEGLMAFFFLVVGLEIKRELVCGELRDRRTAMLPAIAAAGGMVVPALIYLAVDCGHEHRGTAGAYRWRPTLRLPSACSACSARVCRRG